MLLEIKPNQTISKTTKNKGKNNSIRYDSFMIFFYNRNPFQQLEEERKEAELRLEKMKNEMEGVFDLKVKEKITRLKESEQNVIFSSMQQFSF